MLKKTNYQKIEVREVCREWRHGILVLIYFDRFLCVVEGRKLIKWSTSDASGTRKLGTQNSGFGLNLWLDYPL